MPGAAAGPLCAGPAIHIHASGRVEDDIWRSGLRTGLIVGIALARHFLKHAIDCANVEVHMLIEAGAEAVDEGDCAYVQGRLVSMGRVLHEGQTPRPLQERATR